MLHLDTLLRRSSSLYCGGRWGSRTSLSPTTRNSTALPCSRWNSSASALGSLRARLLPHFRTLAVITPSFCIYNDYTRRIHSTQDTYLVVGRTIITLTRWCWGVWRRCRRRRGSPL